MADGEPIRPESYTSSRRLGGSDFSDVVDAEKVAAQFSTGATVVAQSLHRTQSGVGRFVSALTDEVSHPVQANSYLTPPGARGLAPHEDRHDVFVVQVHGSKRWDVDGLGELEVSDGDVLYLPAGTRHSAVSTAQASLHLTIGVLRVTYRSVIERALHNGPDSLDDPLPLRYRDPDVALAEALDRRLTEVAGYFAELGSDVLVERERSRRRQHLAPLDALQRSVAGIELDATTTIRAIGRWCVSESDERVAVDVEDRHLDAPLACVRTIRALEPGTDFLVDDLPGLDAASRVVIARRLVGARLCEVVTSSSN